MMTDPSPENQIPEFSRPIDIDRLPKNAPYLFDETATLAECKALAKLFGARSVQKVRISGALNPLDKDGWQLEAKVGASVTQSCVVALICL